MKTQMTFEKFEQNLRNLIREERLKSGMSQAELAKKNGALTISTVSKFEAGQTPNITLKSIYEMAKSVSLPMFELVKQAEQYRESEHQQPLWQKVAKNVDYLPENKKNWLARILQEALQGIT